MRSATLLLLVNLLLLTTFVPARAQVKEKNGVKYACQLYLPKGYGDSKKAYPLVIYLHGGSQRGNDLTKLDIYGLPYLIKQGKEYDFIMVAPQCPEGKFWSTENWFDSLYTDITARYRIDRNRVYLTGISMGGYGTWQTAVAYPNTFAAILPLCGGCDDSTQICQIRHVPVWTFHGTADDEVPFDETERLVKRLKTCNGTVQFTRLKNEGHGIQYLYEDRKLYDWLLSKHK